MKRQDFRIIFASSFICSLVGCTTVTMHSPSGEEIEMTPDQFTAYVEEVYRRQNDVSGKVIRAGIDFDEEVDSPELITAAARKMVKACEPFSKIVSESLLKELTGKGPNLELANSVPACDGASREAEAALP